MKKILFIMNIIDNGGSAILLKTILNNIDLTKYQITILSIARNEEYENDIPEEVKIRHIYKRDPNLSKNKIIRLSYSFFKELVPCYFVRKFIIKNDYDLAIDFKGLNLNILSSCKAKKILWSQKDYSPETNPLEKLWLDNHSKKISGRYKIWAFKKNLKKIDKIICVSERMKQGFKKRWGEELDVSVVNNALDIKEIRRRSVMDVDYDKPMNFTFCCMSRLAKGKGLERLFRCVKRLNNEGYVFSLDVIGGGIGYDYIKRYLDDLNIPNIRLLGNKENPYPYVKKADVVVLPSETESYGLAFCETVIIGTPVIMTDVGIAPDVMKNGRYGILVENKETKIYEGLKKFLDDKSYVSKFRNNSIEDVDYFNLKKIIANVEAILDE